VANNPIIFIDPNGMEIVDKDGNRITNSEEDGWSDNATDDVKIIYAALMLTETGQKQWDKIYNSDRQATMEISTEEAYKSDSGKLIIGGQEGDGELALGVALKHMEKNSETHSIEVSDDPINIIIFTGSIEKSNFAKGLTMLEAIGAVAGHEIEHTTEQNVSITNHNRRMKSLLMPSSMMRDVERIPTRVGNQIRRESLGFPSYIPKKQQL
jgi:hypothetical protein